MPEYSSMEILKNKLVLAITEGANSFSLSWLIEKIVNLLNYLIKLKVIYKKYNIYFIQNLF